MCRNTIGHVFVYPFLGSEMKQKVLPKGMFLSHIEVTILFSVKCVCLFSFFIEKLELLANLKGFYTSVSLRKQPTFCYTATGFAVK